MRMPLRVISFTLLFAAFSIAQTATTTLPPAKPSARSATASSEPQGVAGDCPGGFNCNGERKAAAVTVTAPSAAKSTWQAIHNSALVVDTHADTPGRFVDENFDLSQDAGRGYMDFNKIRAGNLGAEFWSIWVDPKAFKGQEIKRALEMIDSVYEQARLHPDKMMMAFSTQDIYAAHRQHKLAALMGLEGGHAIQDDIRVLRDYYRLGVRYMTLTWSNTNELGDSSGDLSNKDIEHHNGITDFGRQVVREMNRMGMMVDISHVADRTMFQALATSRAPVIASHSSARALTNVPRNMTDDMLVALARNGGVAQVNFYCGFISQKWVDQAKKLAEEKDPDYERVQSLFMSQRTPQMTQQLYEAEIVLQKSLPRPPLTDLIDHIDHMAKIAGVDHVGIGSDFDGIDCSPAGIDSVADLPKITQALYERGYKPADIQKILGGNLMRVFSEVEKTAKVIQTEDAHQDTRREIAPVAQSQK
jgi:membrane dipeptidase